MSKSLKVFDIVEKLKINISAIKETLIDSSLSIEAIITTEKLLECLKGIMKSMKDTTELEIQLVNLKAQFELKNTENITLKEDINRHNNDIERKYKVLFIIKKVEKNK